jgi:S1-C subfamily serine protease
MPDQEPEFDDHDDVEFIGPPLPPDDRLWRHPSEIASGERTTSAAQSAPAAGRRPRFRKATSFFSGRPTTRAGALSAGLAGAMLATALVLVGTHIAETMGHGNPTLDATSVTVHETSSSVPRHVDTTIVNPTAISDALQTMASRIGEATVLVTAYHGSHAEHGTGLVFASQCLVVTAYSLVEGADSVMLSLPDGTNAAAQVLGVDPATGIAVLRCPATHLATVNSSSRVTVNTHELVAVVGTRPAGSAELDFGFVSAPPSPVTVGNNQLLEEIRTDIPDHDGTALVGYDGAVVGLVVGTVGGSAVATPTWLAMDAANEIVRSGKVVSGVLGVRGAPASGTHPGVKVLSVAARGAAAKAGLVAGDVIETVDGSPTPTVSALRAKLHCLGPGTNVSIVFERHGKDLRASAILLKATSAG